MRRKMWECTARRRRKQAKRARQDVAIDLESQQSANPTDEAITSGLPVTRPRSAATLLNLRFPQSNGRFGCFSERILYVSKCLFSQGVRTRMPAIGPVQSSI